MKKIQIIRGGQVHPVRLANGDKYDSLMVIYEDGVPIEHFDFVNTDFTSGYRGGIVEEGEYRFVVAKFKGKYLAPLISNHITYKDWHNNPNKDYTLPSLIPNPNHGGKKIITGVFVHCGGRLTDGSHGCMTVYPPDWERFTKHFTTENETGKFSLVRSKEWIPPDYYVK